MKHIKIKLSHFNAVKCSIKLIKSLLNAHYCAHICKYSVKDFKMREFFSPFFLLQEGLEKKRIVWNNPTIFSGVSLNSAILV